MDIKWVNEVQGLSLREQWNKLYQRKIKENYPGLWGKNKDTSKYNILKSQLPGVFKKYGIKSIVDVGCGNFFWLNSIKWGDVAYLGLDIVPDLIESNKKKYPTFEFRCADLVVDPIPQADMIFVRSVFIHLTNADIMMLIGNIKASGSKYMMASTTFNIPENRNTHSLLLTKRDLMKPPFSLPKPLEIIMEHEPTNNKEIYTAMGIWDIKNI